jgi:hypothetical protein
MLAVRKSWFQNALQDPAFFNAALSHYAGSFSLKFKKGDPMEALILRTEAIKIVNERIEAGAVGVGDGTIGAVASLVTYEVLGPLFLNYVADFDEDAGK